MENLQTNYNDKKFRRYTGVKFLILTGIIVLGISLYASFKLGFAAREIDIANEDASLWGQLFGSGKKEEEPKGILTNDADYVMPEKEKNRLDILILGIRGDEHEDEDETGSYLTDTMMIFSYDKEAKKASLVSVPRDFYIKISKNKEGKINEAYETGILRKQGLDFSKTLLSKITGVYIDHAIVFDFESFEQIVDVLGGIDVHLDKPFTEAQQWGYEFTLPAGDNHLDGQSALYYVRSRYSSNDFDRAQRQQKVMLAIKDKITNLQLLDDPGKTFEIVNTIRKNISTDINIFDIGGLIGLAKEMDGLEKNMKKQTLTTENIFYESNVNGIYILLPKGDNFMGIKNLFQEILK